MKLPLPLVAVAACLSAAADGMRPLEYEEIRISPCVDAFRVARDRVREMKRAAGGELGKTLIVIFEDGLYPVTSPAEFTSADSGTPAHPILYRAANRGRAVFTGALTLSWHRPAADDPRLTLIPAAARGRVVTAELPATGELPGFGGGRTFLNECPLLLYANGLMLPQAAWPDAAANWTDLGAEWAKVAVTDEILARNKKDESRAVFLADSPHLAEWAKEPDPWAFGMWRVEWDDACSPILFVNPATREVTLDRKALSYTPNRKGWYRVLNMLSELDRPGEWAIDRKARRIYLWPKEGAPAAVASWARGFVSAKNLTDVTFEGFKFRHARGDALLFENCRGVSVTGSELRECGGWGVVFEGGRDCRAEGNDLFHIGEGGICVSGGERVTLSPGRTAAVNNHIGWFGERLWSYRPAIALGSITDLRTFDAVGCRIEHNLIHHSRHMAISIAGNNNVIGYNIIHDTCAWTYDAGAIYGYSDVDWTEGRGDVVEYNTVYMTGKADAPHLIEALYLDGILSGVTLRGNIVVRSGHGLFQNGGHANRFERNLCCRCIEGELKNDLGYRNPHTAADSGGWSNLQRYRTLYESSPWRETFPEVAKMAAMTDPLFAQCTLFFKSHDNVFAASGPSRYQNLKRLGNYVEIGGNLQLEGDPGFVDYAGFDWNLKPGTPAYEKLGNNRFSEMGLFPSSLRASAPVKFGEGVTPPGPMKRPLGIAIAKFDITCPGRTFTAERPMATELEGCGIMSAKYCPALNRISVGGRELRLADGWIEKSFSFTPTVDGDYDFHLMGNYGSKTMWDDLEMTGGELVNGGFENGEGWTELFSPPPIDETNCRDIEPPCGLLLATDGNLPRSGTRFAVTSHYRALSQRIRLKAGVRVTFTYRARAWNDSVVSESQIKRN